MQRLGRLRPGSSIARRLAAATTLLLLAVVTVLGFEVVGIEREADLVRRQTALAVSADGPSRLLINLQNERSWAAVEVIGQGDEAELFVEGYEETRQRTDEALAGFQDLLAGAPDETRRAFAPAVDGLAAELASLREAIDAGPMPRTLMNLSFGEKVFGRYTVLVEPFFAGIGAVALAIEQPDLRQGAELIDLTTRQVEALGLLGQEVGLTSILSPGGIDQRAEIAEVAALRWRFTDLAEQIRAKSTGIYAGAGDDDLFVGFTDAMNGQVDAALAGDFDVEELLATIAPDPEDTYLGYRERVADILLDRADTIGDGAARRERALLALVAMTAAAALTLVVVAARSVTRPLRALAEQMMGPPTTACPRPSTPCCRPQPTPTSSPRSWRRSPSRAPTRSASWPG